MAIFEMNANMFVDDRALGTTRSTSQVCRSWRNIMLVTPSIWAKLIDLDYCRNSTKCTINIMCDTKLASAQVLKPEKMM